MTHYLPVYNNVCADKWLVVNYLYSICDLIKLPYQLTQSIKHDSQWTGEILITNYDIADHIESYIKKFIHEICHWLISDLVRRQYKDFGHYKLNTDEDEDADAILNLQESIDEEQLVIGLQECYIELLENRFKVLQTLNLIISSGITLYNEAIKKELTDRDLIDHNNLPIYLP